jgi:CheY-like chemotaxis protein
MPAETILVVEDTELLRRIYVDRLKQEGYDVLTAADGAECLKVVRANHVDLVLLDLVMPRMGGLEALETLKGDPRTRAIPVLILSNLGEETDLKRGLKMGAEDYLVKNSSKPAEVSSKIRATLDAAAARAAAAPPATTVTEPPAATAETAPEEPSVVAEEPATVGATCAHYDLYVRDHEGDADRLVSEVRLQRRLWCPACEAELVVRLQICSDHTGSYDAIVVCPSCTRTF